MRPQQLVSSKHVQSSGLLRSSLSSSSLSWSLLSLSSSSPAKYLKKKKKKRIHRRELLKFTFESEGMSRNVKEATLQNLNIDILSTYSLLSKVPLSVARGEDDKWGIRAQRHVPSKRLHGRNGHSSISCSSWTAGRVQCMCLDHSTHCCLVHCQGRNIPLAVNADLM